MGKLIKNHWARLIVLTAAAYQLAAALEGFFWPKIFWDFLTKNLDTAVKPFPTLQIINLLLSLLGLAWEWPLAPLVKAVPSAHRSIEARLVILPLSALAAVLLYQATNAALYYLIGMGVYFWAFCEGETVCPEPWTLPKRTPRTGKSDGNEQTKKKRAASLSKEHEKAPRRRRTTNVEPEDSDGAQIEGRTQINAEASDVTDGDDGSPEADYILAEMTDEAPGKQESAISLPLIQRILQEHFEGKARTRMTTDARQVVGKYIEIFAREAIMRSAYERHERDKADGAGSISSGWLEVEDLERIAPQLSLVPIILLATAAAATSGGSGSNGSNGGAGSWAAWPSSSSSVAPAQANASPSSSPSASPASLAAGEQLIQVVSVSDANGSLKYFPNSVQAPVGSIVQFQFHPKNHTITESTFAAPCQPIAQTNASLITETRPGIKSGFLPVTLADTELPVYNVLINDTKPIWLYCGQTNHSAPLLRPMEGGGGQIAAAAFVAGLVALL
ncbi:hypothetical protein DV735_g4095, partial [Chaetothyriales sp. CBS 134920]